MKSSKRWLSVLGIVIFGILCFAMGYVCNALWDKTDAGQEQSPMIDSFDVFSSATFEGSHATDDIPWGYTAGVFDMEQGECILLTPNTSVNLQGDNTLSSWTFEYRIHPWVEAGSDGAGLIIRILDAEENILYSEEIPVKIDGGWQTYSVDMSPYDTVSAVKIMCDNGSADNDECDWVILRAQGVVPGRSFSGSYVRSATYFADEWPLNFWNCEMDHLDDNLAQIRADGFDSIIIVIPWREFQPAISPISYNDYAFAKLDEVMSAADDAGLKVYTRLGYTWDYYEDENEDIVDRFGALLGDEDTLAAWDDYIRKMYQVLSSYDSFAEAFLTWEDFWGSTKICDVQALSDRIAKAQYMKYGEWVSAHYSLEEYNRLYGTEYTTYDLIPIPHRSEPALWAMFEFYDDFLLGILERSQQSFPNLSMEVRMDWDLVMDVQGNPVYYKHNKLYSCANSDFSTTMYGIPMGFQNVGELVTYEEALKQTQYTLENFKTDTGGKSVYIDQFIFADNTPDFSNNARIKEDELDDYLLNVADTLRGWSEGYGIWTYRNYRSNMLYNPQFVLADNGWDIWGGVTFQELEGSMVCHISPEGALKQSIPDLRDHFSAEQYFLELEVVELTTPGILEIQVGDTVFREEITDIGKVQLVLDRPDCYDLSISSIDSELTIDNIKFYSQIQQGYLYDEDFGELECIDEIRILNEMLSADGK
ncbi:MAG: hypothetical protein NC079_12020 [Clostridium sp.]|nr:hypothetical protein [Acetatifactor muris]MCM1525819.1 hypothetical protein [Bacteroides sp.]MCM1564317.1 hypothetical protein [Clostridium sp.]